jgi:iron complex transport system ATP-binding protein
MLPSEIIVRQKMQPPLLELSNVSVQRGQRLALDRLSLSIAAGEHVAILGPNGCGKSTLIKTITRECYPLLDPASHFRILGKDTWNIFDLRAHLGVVSNDLMQQSTRDITGRELVLSGFFGSIGIWPNHHVTSQMEQTAHQVMSELDAAHLANRWLDELSSGEARRLLIARALIHRPQTLLLDEPTTSLDLGGLEELRSHLRVLAKAGTGIVLVTHHLDDIIPEIDRVVLLKAGRVYRDGPKGAILTTEALSDAFGVKPQILQRNGFYHAW